MAEDVSFTPSAAGPSAPLWQQVLEDLERRLALGEFGTRFPTDRELVEHYGTSRHTVREAVRHLKARGIIERERGRGSTVTAAESPTQPVGALYNLFQAVERAGRSQHSVVLLLDQRTDGEAAAKFGFDPATPLVHLERLRYMDDVPLALDTVWIAPDVGRRLLGVDFEHTSLYDELFTHAGIRPSAGREHLMAVAPDEAMAEVLELEVGEALLRIERIAEHAGRVIEYRLTLLRSSRLAIVTEWPGPTILTGEVLAP